MPTLPPTDLFTKITAQFVSRIAWWAKLSGNVRGSIWALLSAGVAIIQITLVKMLGETLHLTEIIFFRQLFILGVVLPVLMRNFPEAFKTRYYGLHFLRIAGALAAMLLGFTAVINMPLADATTIGFSKSFFVTIFAIFFLGETVGHRRWFAVGVGFIGVMIVMQPGGEGLSFGLYGLMALGGAAGAGMVMVIIRRISQSDTTITILAYQSIGVGVVMIIPAIWYWQTPTLYELGLLVGLGCVSVLVQTFNIHAYRAGEASAIASIDYTRLVYALIVGWLLFGDWPEKTVLIGAAIIIGAALYTIHREARLGRKLTRIDENTGISGADEK